MIYMLMFEKRSVKLCRKVYFIIILPRGIADRVRLWVVNLLKLMDLFTQMNVHLLPLWDFPQL